MTVDPRIGEAMRDGGRKAAECLRAYWSEGALPIDPVRIAERMGVQVLEALLPDDVSGAVAKQPDAAPIVLVQRGEPEVRKRFTIAHELGHYMRRAGSDSIDYVDFRGAKARLGSDPEEVYANNFAANLLMPAAEVKKLWKETGDEVGLAQRFCVSIDAMSHRLRNLNLGG